MNLLEFRKNIGVKDLSEEFENLINFQINQSNGIEYSDGFGVRIDEKSGLRSWSNDEVFLSKLLPFAKANASGSFYAFWINDETKSLNQLPIVVFGDEGGEHVVAENILQLMHLLTHDAELYVNSAEVCFKKRKKKPSDNLEKYLVWIKENYNLDRIKDPEHIISLAQEKYQEDFNKWLKNYYDIDEIYRSRIKNYLNLIEKLKGKEYIIKQIFVVIRKNDECLNIFAEYMETATDEIKKLVIGEVEKIKKKEDKEKLIEKLKLKK